MDQYLYQRVLHEAADVVIINLRGMISPQFQHQKKYLGEFVELFMIPVLNQSLLQKFWLGVISWNVRVWPKQYSENKVSVLTRNWQKIKNKKIQRKTKIVLSLHVFI